MLMNWQWRLLVDEIQLMGQSSIYLEMPCCRACDINLGSMDGLFCCSLESSKISSQMVDQENSVLSNCREQYSASQSLCPPLTRGCCSRKAL